MASERGAGFGDREEGTVDDFMFRLVRVWLNFFTSRYLTVPASPDVILCV